jgi:hypothetical protein
LLAVRAWIPRAVAVLALVAAAGCRDGAVTLSFRPKASATYEYEATVVSSTTTTLPGHAPETNDGRAVLRARHRVLATDAGQAEVEVVLARPGIGERTYVMRFDRAAQLTKVETVEGLRSADLGPVGLSEIFPAAAGAPPDERLHPGDRWVIDDSVQLPGMDAAARLQGDGQLVELGVEDGHDTAKVRSRTQLPVHARSSADNGFQVLDGTQTTDVVATYDLADGSVLGATATTTATFRLTLEPPAGQPGTPIVGSLTIDVRSTTRRTA